MTRSLYLTLFLLIGCYGSIPPHPVSVALPMLSDEAIINVSSQSRTVIENRKKKERTCPADITDENSPKCLVTEREVAEPVTRVETTMTYGAEVINYAQFRVLTDPRYNDKVARLDELRGRCSRANVPRWIGTTLILGGLITALVGSDDRVSDTVGYAGLGAVGTGFTSYAIGYYKFGGSDCNAARQIFHDVDLRQEVGWTKVEGAERADEMAAVAKQFNDLRLLRGDAPAPDTSPPSDVEQAPGPNAAASPALDAPK